MRNIYPWASWLNQRGFIAIRDVHFRCSTQTFLNMLRQRAVGRGISLHVETHDDGRIVSVTSTKLESEADLFVEVR